MTAGLLEFGDAGAALVAEFDNGCSAVGCFGLVGGLRRNSYNRILLAQAQALAPAGTVVVVWDQLAAVPPLDERFA